MPYAIEVTAPLITPPFPSPPLFVQLIPSVLDAILELPEPPPATHKPLPYAIQTPCALVPITLRGVQVIPFVLVARLIVPIPPIAIHNPLPELFLPYATFLLAIIDPRPVHVSPSVEVATLFPPSPTATHKPLPYATPYAVSVKTVEPRPVQVVPLVLVAMVFP